MGAPRIPLFAVLSLLCIVGIAVLMGLALSRLLTQAAIEFEWNAIAMVARHEAREVGLDRVFDAAVGPDERDRLGRELVKRLLSTESDILSLKIWGRDGTVIWSDIPEQVGRRFPDNHALDRALAGSIVVDLPGPGDEDSDIERRDFSAVAELYVPLQSAGSVSGILEVYTDPAQLLASIKKGHLAVWWISGVGGLTLYLLLFPVFRYASQRQSAYAGQLERAVTQRTEELQKAQEQMIRQERLRALGQMASGIAHDFNNALTPIVASIEMLLSRPDLLDDRERVMRHLKRIRTGGADAAHVVTRLREFYREREETDVLVPVDINRVVEQAIGLTRPKWNSEALATARPISIEKELSPLLPVAGDECALREMLTNLVLNAVDAMPDGGTLTIRTRLESGGTAGDPPTANAPRSPAVLLELCDTGIGMTDEVRRRCLEPFFSTKGERGSGLGLAMAFGTIKRHSGSIHIESEPGLGTRVIVRLPALVRQTAEAVPELLAPSRPLRILLVDDDPPSLEALVDCLTCDGHAVETAPDGQEGLRKLHRGEFDVVVTDRAMPGVNGDRLAALMKAAMPHVPIIMLTGFGSLMEAQGERPEGVAMLVPKPATLAGLRHALATVERS